MIQSVEDLERVIRRSEMNRGQTTLLKYLYQTDDKSEDDGGYAKRSDIVSDIRWDDPKSFVGVLAAFSNRVNSTEGISGTPGYEAFIERRDIDGQECFRLREEARRAIEAVPLLKQTIEEQPMEDLLDKKGVPLEFEDVSLAESMTDVEGREEIGWNPSTPENELLLGYWKQVRGTIITEVETGSSGPSAWPSGSGRRKIDGLRFSSEYRDEINSQTAFSQAQLRDIVQDRHVETIEVKQSLGRPVIGQAIAGRDLFERDYNPNTAEAVVICERGDPALEWVCRQNRVRVEMIERKEVA
jgi:hypothetical protein